MNYYCMVRLAIHQRNQSCEQETLLLLHSSGKARIHPLLVSSMTMVWARHLLQKSWTFHSGILKIGQRKTHSSNLMSVPKSLSSQAIMVQITNMIFFSKMLYFFLNCELRDPISALSVVVHVYSLSQEFEIKAWEVKHRAIARFQKSGHMCTIWECTNPSMIHMRLKMTQESGWQL